MTSQKPILIFDTSVINKLFDENQEFGPLAAGLEAGYWVRLTGSNISELAATQEPERRTKLFDTCRRLLSSGECIDPFAWIVEKHVKAFDQNEEHYEWESVDIRNAPIGKHVALPTAFDDELAVRQKESATKMQRGFEDWFCRMRPDFDDILARGVPRPQNFAAFVTILQEPSGAFWTGYGRMIYARFVAEEPDEQKLRRFAGRCPPFLMMVLALARAQYSRAIVDRPTKKKRAGRVDLLTSVYLPYCSAFVTHDDDHAVCLSEMARIAKLDREILSYTNFRRRLSCL